jgi:hypothetical protein
LQASAIAIIARCRWPPESARRVGTHPLVQLQHFADLVAHRVQRVERRHRLLEDHADAAAADAAHRTFAQTHQVLAVEADLAGRVRRVDQPQDRQRRDRLARSGLAHQRELLAGGDGERDVVDDGRRAEADRQVADVEQLVHVRISACRRHRAARRR